MARPFHRRRRKTDYRPELKDMFSALRSLTLPSFLTWWTQELRNLVPEKIRHWYRASSRIVAVRHDGSGVSFFHLSVNTLEEVGRIDANPERLAEQRQGVRSILTKIGGSPQVFVCLPEEQTLRHQLQLPLAVEENLLQSIEFELDRYTPFKPHHVYYNARVLGRDTARRLLSVELLVIPRAAADRLLRATSELGLMAHGAVLADDLALHGDQCANLLPAATHPKRGQRALRFRFAALTLTMILLGTALAIPVWQKRNIAILMNDQAINAKAAAQATDRLREQLDSLVVELNFVHQKKWSTAPVLLLLEDLSRLLPDDTYLQQLDINGNELQIQGETASTSKVIEFMEQSRFFRNETFKSPVTKIPGTASERFHIAAEIKLAPPPTAKAETRHEISIDVPSGATNAATTAPAQTTPPTELSRKPENKTP